MRAFNRTNESSTSTDSIKSTSACSYCGDVDHQVTKCPHAKSDWAMFQAFTIPCSDADNWTNNPKAKAVGQRWNSQSNNARWFKDPSGWSKWYVACEKAVGKIKKAEQREANKAKAKAKGKRATKCGFCGGVGHNRRDCLQMQALNKRFITANNHWRQRLYAYFVEELGLGNGALVKVTKQSGWQAPKVESVAIVTSINWDELNMFCYTEQDKRGWRGTHGERVHDNLGAPLAIRIVVDGKEEWLKWPATQNTKGSTTNMINDEHGRPLADQFPYSWTAPEYHSMVSPTETPLSNEWLTQGQAECVEFITKKYSLQKLKDWQAISLLESYEKRYNLK